MHCLLVGNYGDKNLGDEALREAMLAFFPDVAWTVVSADPQPEELPRLPAGIRSLCAGGWRRTLRAMRECDAVVFGGGTLFTDIESVRACFLWWLHVAVATALKRPVLLAFQGIGPFRTALGEWLARDAIRRSMFLSVRDGASRGRVDSWGLNKKIIQTFDPVFLLCHAKKSEERSKKVFVIIPRKNSGAPFLKTVRTLAAAEAWEAIHIVLLKPDDVYEQNLAETLRGEFSQPTDIRPVRTLQELIESIADATLVCTQRYHAAIAAIACEKHCIVVPQGDNDKLAELVPLLAAAPRDRTGPLLQAVDDGKQALDEALRTLPKENP